MRVAVWTPLPPEPSGIADYNMVLLKAMARSPGVELTAIVRDDADHAVAPPGVRVRHAREYRGEDYDIDLYHVGNNPTFHTYMLQPALSRAGVLVLHDPAIADFIEVVLGGRQRKIFEVEAAFNLGLSERDDAVVDAINQWDRTTLLLSRRLIEANHVTLVHSAWAAAHLSARFTGAEVHAVPFAVEIDPQRLVPRRHLELTFGVFGNISFHKRVPEVVAAFAEARRRGLRARLIVAGRRDSTEAERRIERLIDSERLADHVDFHVDVAGDDFRRLQESCDVLVGLRWPTAGETSASLLECFALGKAAIVSDVAQNAEFPEEFCRRIGLDARYEHEELVSALLDAATDIAATRDAGRAALEYVTAHCRAEDVARRYVQELRRASALAPLVDPFAEEIDPIGVNAIGSWAGATGLAEAGRRALLALLDEGISVALEDVNLWAKIDTSRVPHRIATLPHGHPYRIAVSFLNVNEFHVITDSQLRGASTDYLIAMWYWELPSLPEEMHKEIARVDEIWVASEFVREVFLRYTKKPIFVMP